MNRGIKWNHLIGDTEKINLIADIGKSVPTQDRLVIKIVTFDCNGLALALKSRILFTKNL